jgi:hypothetical protein
MALVNNIRLVENTFFPDPSRVNKKLFPKILLFPDNLIISRFILKINQISSEISLFREFICCGGKLLDVTCLFALSDWCSSPRWPVRECSLKFLARFQANPDIALTANFCTKACCVCCSRCTVHLLGCLSSQKKTCGVYVVTFDPCLALLLSSH